MPSSILNSDDGVISGTAGLKNSGGDDGVLVFQSKGTETARINTDKQIVAAAGTALLPSITTTGDVNTGVFFPAADNIGFATNGVIRGRWTTDGLCFGSDTAAANALDDYEEGTFTPDFFNNGASSTWSVKQGLYRKVGSLVTCWMNCSGSGDSGGGGGAIIFDLPFAMASGQPGFFGLAATIGGTGSPYEQLNAAGGTGTQGQMLHNVAGSQEQGTLTTVRACISYVTN